MLDPAFFLIGTKDLRCQRAHSASSGHLPKLLPVLLSGVVLLVPDPSILRPYAPGSYGVQNPLGVARSEE